MLFHMQTLIFILRMFWLTEALSVAHLPARPEPTAVIKPGIYSDRKMPERLSLVLYADSTFQLINFDFANPSKEGISFGRWSIGGEDSLTLHVDHDWLYLQEEKYDPELPGGQVHAWLLGRKNDTLGMSYLINEGKQAFDLFWESHGYVDDEDSDHMRNIGIWRIHPRRYVFQQVEGEWKVNVTSFSHKPVLIDSLRVYLYRSDFDIPVYTQTFMVNCDTCNSFVIKSKYEHVAIGLAPNRQLEKNKTYHFLCKQDTIYLAPLMGSNVVWSDHVQH